MDSKEENVFHHKEFSRKWILLQSQLDKNFVTLYVSERLRCQLKEAAGLCRLAGRLQLFSPHRFFSVPKLGNICLKSKIRVWEARMFLTWYNIAFSCVRKARFLSTTNASRAAKLANRLHPQHDVSATTFPSLVRPLDAKYQNSFLDVIIRTIKKRQFNV